MTVSPWIQHADFETTDLPEHAPEALVAALMGHDWRAEVARMNDLKAAGNDNCPPGFGINSLKDDRTLHIWFDTGGLCSVDYSFFDRARVLGVFPKRKYHAGVLENVPLESAALFVEPFLANSYNDVKCEVEMRS